AAGADADTRVGGRGVHRLRGPRAIAGAFRGADAERGGGQILVEGLCPERHARRPPVRCGESGGGPAGTDATVGRWIGGASGGRRAGRVAGKSEAVQARLSAILREVLSGAECTAARPQELRTTRAAG